MIMVGLSDNGGMVCQVGMNHYEDVENVEKRPTTQMNVAFSMGRLMRSMKTQIMRMIYYRSFCEEFRGFSHQTQ